MVSPVMLSEMVALGLFGEEELQSRFSMVLMLVHWSDKRWGLGGGDDSSGGAHEVLDLLTGRHLCRLMGASFCCSLGLVIVGDSMVERIWW